MSNFKKCVRCNSENITIVSTGGNIKLYYPEVHDYFKGTYQRVCTVSKAVVCESCGHVELLVEINEQEK